MPDRSQKNGVARAHCASRIPIRVVVLSCGELGILVANSLAKLESVGEVALVQSQWPASRENKFVVRKVAEVYRRQGAKGILQRVAAHLAPLVSRRSARNEPPLLASTVSHCVFADLHSAETVSFIRAFGADLGVIAGTHVLRESLFNLPRLGSINIHSGRVPDYRGSAPAFWELYDGREEVGITIHQVTTVLDGGDVLLAESFPLNCAPAGDPMAYVERYREEVLRPNGIRMVTQCVDLIARGMAVSAPQPEGRGKTNKQPLYTDIRELRRRVARRRKERNARREAVA